MDKRENYLNAIKILQNIDECRPLSANVFHSYSLNSVKELLQFLQDNSQRGGYVKNLWNNEYTLLPFLDDSQNEWLKFDLPCVVDFYVQIRLSVKTRFTDFIEFQEYIQREYWHMPPCSEIMIKVPVFGCWDRAEFIATFLESHHFNIERLYFYGDKIQRGHSFCIYHDEKWKTCDISNCYGSASEKDEIYERIFCCLNNWDAYRDSDSTTLVKISKPPICASTKDFLKNVERGIVLMRR